MQCLHVNFSGCKASVILCEKTTKPFLIVHIDNTGAIYPLVFLKTLSSIEAVIPSALSFF